MKKYLMDVYERLVLGHAFAALVVLVAVAGFFAWHATEFKLDASADTLLLENDQDLRYYRGTRARYGSDDYLLITYTTTEDLFAPESLKDIQVLRDKLAGLANVESVITILDVPLVNSPRTSFRELQKEVPTLLSDRTDVALARIELTQSALYSDLIMSRDGLTTMLLLTFREDPQYRTLVSRRAQLREQDLFSGLSVVETAELEDLGHQIRDQRVIRTTAQQADIATIRTILDPHRSAAEIHLGGLPLIVSDMVSYIKHDVTVFGAGILVFLVLLLALIFRRPRWVVLPLLCCTLAVVVMMGALGIIDWPVTVVSANFVALLLIFSLSITVHLVVRYRELHALNPGRDQFWLVSSTVRDKLRPCLYTTATTMVGFGSLLVSGIRPVIDFGWMMVIGMLVIFVLAFTLFPLGLMLLPAGLPHERRDFTGRITNYFARFIEHFGKLTAGLFLALGLISAWGISTLTVENRFIDYFKESTEIYQGMITIDEKLGGTTPFDVIIDADPEFLAARAADAQGTSGTVDDEFADEFGDEFADEFADEGDLGSSSYWYNTYRLGQVHEIHEYLESLPETGKVLSMATTLKTLQVLNDDEEPSTFFLSLLYQRLPEGIKKVMFSPYMSEDGNQMRFSVRIFESDLTLRRAELLQKIRQQLVSEFGIADERIHLTGMLVLYNNVLQSLFRSQILTIGVVFVAIMLMFVTLFRSVRIAFIAIVPSMLAAGSVLGMMGLLSIPLDVMTITIAAISIGIGVDHSIHYVHRFIDEFSKDRSYLAAIERCHKSIGRAIYYTSVIIIAGFSMLSLSSFIPTIYFGLFTGFSMLIALVANLTLLPLLLRWLRPIS